VNTSFPDEIKPAVTDVSEVQVVADYRNGGKSCSHAVKRRLPAGPFQHSRIGEVKPVHQSLLRIGFIGTRVEFLHAFYSDVAGELPAFGAPHAVGDYGKPPQAGSQ
jgi:hypothetical protein